MNAKTINAKLARINFTLGPYFPMSNYNLMLVLILKFHVTFEYSKDDDGKIVHYATIHGEHYGEPMFYSNALEAAAMVIIRKYECEHGEVRPLHF